MKIALAQINTTVADFAGNLSRIEAALEEGRRQGAELVVFPEQAIPGYPAEDLLEREDFLRETEAAFERAVLLSRGIAMVVGTLWRAAGGEGNPVYNTAALVADGKVLGVEHKTLLPTYDVFDEGRYFRPAEGQQVFPFGGRRLGLAICEDLWNDPEFWPRRRYPRDPVAELVERQGADLLVAISASPFSLGRPAFRKRMLRATVERYGVGLAYCNLVGGNTSLVFDGGSFALDAAGELIASGASFEEDFVTFVLPPPAPGRPARRRPRREAPPGEPAGGAERAEPGDGRERVGRALSERDVEDAYRALVLGTRDYIRKSGFRRAVVGLSGGIDSSLTAAVAVDALGAESVLGISMPSRYSSAGSVTDAERLAAALGMEIRRLPIEPIFCAVLETLEPLFAGLPPDVTEENIQARVRGLLLMAVSNKTGAIVLTTGNKSELAAGYCTLYGDMSGGLAVISDVPKTLVYRIARWLNREREVIPWASIEKAPSAELRPDQKDQDSLPPYETLDAILEAYIEDGKGVDEIAALGFARDLVVQVVRLVDRNEYKRKQAAPGLRITAKAFGPGRRFPIVRK